MEGRSSEITWLPVALWTPLFCQKCAVAYCVECNITFCSNYILQFQLTSYGTFVLLLNFAFVLSSLYRNRFRIRWFWFTNRGETVRHALTLDIAPNPNPNTNLILNYVLTGLYPLLGRVVRYHRIGNRVRFGLRKESRYGTPVQINRKLRIAIALILLLSVLRTAVMWQEITTLSSASSVSICLAAMDHA